MDLGFYSVLYSWVSGAAWDVVKCLGHQPRVGGIWCKSGRYSDAAASVGVMGCLGASERVAEVYERAAESSSTPYRQWSNDEISWASE